MIEELYFGNINPIEKNFEKESYVTAMRTVSDNEEKLKEVLEGENREWFIHMIGAQGDLLGITAVESFTDGFRLGAKIAMEILEDSASPEERRLKNELMRRLLRKMEE